MDAKRDHLSQHVEGRRHMQGAVFAGPRPVVLDVHPLADSDHPILMPGKRPVRRWRLVEENGAYRPRPAFERSCGDSADRSVWVQEWLQAIHGEQAHARHVSRLINKNVLKRLKVGSVQGP
jgi:hypothetical protein